MHLLELRAYYICTLQENTHFYRFGNAVACGELLPLSLFPLVLLCEEIVQAIASVGHSDCWTSRDEFVLHAINARCEFYYCEDQIIAV